MGFTKVCLIIHLESMCNTKTIQVSDVFHTGSPESPLWEFKHGNGNFKRGDLVGITACPRSPRLLFCSKTTALPTRDTRRAHTRYARVDRV